MEASAAAGTFPDYCLYDFPGDYVDPALGQRLARLRLAEQEGGRRRYSGRSNVCALLPGYKFTLEGHRRRACNQEYLLVAVQHFGRQPQALPGALAHERSDDLALPGDALTYENQLECIPAEVEFRPPRRTPRPQVGGLQTAVVVGPPGEEVHCDEYGRVKVQFPWDRTDKRDDRSSCWIRVSQPFAGPGYGALFIPRIGHEVLVQFLHGDPDRPLIIGRVYNGENPLPYPLPAAKAISTLRSHSTPGGGGHNELRFDDRKGREELHLHAERNLSVHVGHDASSQVGGDSTTRIGGDSTIRIDANAIEHVAGDSSAKVGGSLITVIETGDHELRVGLGGCQTTMHGHSKTEITAGNSELLVLVGSHLTKAAGAVQIESGQDQLALRAHGPLQAHSQQKVELAAPQIVLTAAHKLTLRVGENSITLDESGIDLAGLQISSSAIGTHAISGALVSIN
jgi:type VI secretion system secreted protein VgrG